MFSRIMEVDDSYMGGKKGNKHKDKKLKTLGRYRQDCRCRSQEYRDKKVKARVIDNTKRYTLHGFIDEDVSEGATICTTTSRATKI